MRNKKRIYEDCPVKLKTNTLNIEFRREEFFKHYAIISYSTDGGEKDVSYERFLDVPYQSVFGCYERWDDSPFPYRRFFILTKQSQKRDVMDCLRKRLTIKFREDDLEEYEDNITKRIIVSLALNSLSADFEESHRVFSNGVLTVWDDNNFTIHRNKSNNPIVGLDIKLDKNLTLTASTKSFLKVNDYNTVRNKWKDYKRLFKLSFTKEGTYTITPFSIKNLDKAEKEENLYEEKSLGRNVVPFWPISIQNYQSGKLVTLWKIVKQLNEQFKGIPESIQEELHIICVLFTEEVGGVFTIVFEEDGRLVIDMEPRSFALIKL